MQVSLQKPLITSIIHGDLSGGFLALSQCPGKKLAKGRDGKPRNRNLDEDVTHWANQGIRLVVCLLNPSELRSLGVQPSDYPRSLTNCGIQLITYPIIEMAAPPSIESASDLLSSIEGIVQSGGGVLVHCRGGIGRAGTIAACYLLYKGLASNPKSAIEAIRAARDPRCVESRRQTDFICSYAKHLTAQRNIAVTMLA